MQLDFDGKHKVFIQKIQFGAYKNNCETHILRLDEIHQVISGNKFFKLQLHISNAINLGFDAIATFGGAYSNHILATACLCKEIGLKSVGIIRGEEPLNKSQTLVQAKDFGMQLHFVTREAFNEKALLKKLYNDDGYYWINEGGYSRLGAEGCQEICSWIDESYTDIVCAVGTGTMMAGLVIGANPQQKITGVSVLKGNDNLINEMRELLSEGEKNKNYRLVSDYHFGGYAKHPQELIDWMNTFYAQAKVPTDIVYTSKLCFAVNDLLKKKYFAPNSKIMIIHSGGLQGNNSLKAGTLAY